MELTNLSWPSEGNLTANTNCTAQTSAQNKSSASVMAARATVTSRTTLLLSLPGSNSIRKVRANSPSITDIKHNKHSECKSPRDDEHLLGILISLGTMSGDIPPAVFLTCPFIRVCWWYSPLLFIVVLLVRLLMLLVLLVFTKWWGFGGSGVRREMCDMSVRCELSRDWSRPVVRVPVPEVTTRIKNIIVLNNSHFPRCLAKAARYSCS